MGGSKPSLKLLHSSLNLNFTLTCSMIINYSSLMKIGIGHSRMLILSYFTDLFIDPFCVQYIAEVYILISSRFHAFPLQYSYLQLQHADGLAWNLQYSEQCHVSLASYWQRCSCIYLMTPLLGAIDLLDAKKNL